MADIRQIRKRTAENARKMKLQKTDLNYIELLAVEESNKLKQIKSLDRSEIQPLTFGYFSFIFILGGEIYAC